MGGFPEGDTEYATTIKDCEKRRKSERARDQKFRRNLKYSHQSPPHRYPKRKTCIKQATLENTEGHASSYPPKLTAQQGIIITNIPFYPISDDRSPESPSITPVCAQVGILRGVGTIRCQLPCLTMEVGP